MELLFLQKVSMRFMKRMLNVDYRNSLAKNARKLIASRYEQGFVRQCLYDFYDEIL